MTVVALGLATAAAYGASDFLGGMASRRAGASLAVVALLKLVAVAVFLVAAPVVGGALDAAALGWGALAGLAVGVGYIAYFRGLAAGPMGIVATITAVCSAAVPLGAGLLLGERPSAAAWAGLVVIVAAIVLVTYARAGAEAAAADARGDAGVEVDELIHCAGSGRAAAPARRPAPVAGALDAGVAGIGFGAFFVALDRASVATGGAALEWPLLAAAASAAVLVGAAALVRGADWGAAWGQAPAVLLAGALYAGGSWAFAIAVGEGWISIVAVIAALSPLPTMLLARVVLAESLSARQAAGALLALVGVALITGGLPE